MGIPIAAAEKCIVGVVNNYAMIKRVEQQGSGWAKVKELAHWKNSKIYYSWKNWEKPTILTHRENRN